MKLFNQHIETISAKLKQQISVADLRQQPQPTFSQMETTKMVHFKNGISLA
jgi:hypothetical protein